MVVKHENVCIVDLLGRYKNHNEMGLIPKGAMRKIGGSDLKLVCASQCMTLVPSKKETLKYCLCVVRWFKRMVQMLNVSQ